MNRIGDIGEKFMEQGQAVVQNTKKQIQQTAQSVTTQVSVTPQSTDASPQAGDAATTQAAGELANLEQNPQQAVQQLGNLMQGQSGKPNPQAAQNNPQNKEKLDLVRKKLWH